MDERALLSPRAASGTPAFRGQSPFLFAARTCRLPRSRSEQAKPALRNSDMRRGRQDRRRGARGPRRGGPRPNSVPIEAAGCGYSR